MTKMMMTLAVALMWVSTDQEPSRPLEDYVLTDDELVQAIEEGRGAKGGMTGLALIPSGSVLDEFPLTRVESKESPRRSTGFSIEVYTPYSWVSQQASLAAKRYQPFTVEDVTEVMRSNVLRVMAYPDMPTVTPEWNRAPTSGVDNVIIRSTAKKGFEVLRPISIEDDWEILHTQKYEEVAYASKRAVFDLERVAEITSLDEKGEFFIVVVGTKYNREFKIKTKFFERLP